MVLPEWMKIPYDEVGITVLILSVIFFFIFPLSVLFILGRQGADLVYWTVLGFVVVIILFLIVRPKKPYRPD